MKFLPATVSDLDALGMRPCDLDAIIVTGDAYVDHASFGAAVIGRVLEARGYTVGILARPDPDDAEAFRLLGKPRLAFLVTAGAIDSMVSSYTANNKPRSGDEYAPGGNAAICLRADGSLGPGIRGRANARPDRATIVYTGMCRQAFKGVPVVLGGIEASLRRLAHYDYWSGTVRRSILLDAKADILVYGMGETAIVEILRRLREAGKGNPPGETGVRAGAGIADLSGIRGTVRARNAPAGPDGDSLETDAIRLPDFEAIAPDDAAGHGAFAESFRTQYRTTDPHSAKTLIERAGSREVVQEPPAFPLPRAELDRLHELPFARAWHPMYDGAGGVPALAEVKFSLVSSRGCFGACSFCSLTFHQGRVITSRSRESLLREARILASMPDFKGYIHDVGGPTANFRAPSCAKAAASGACADRRCLAPEPCSRLEVDHSDYLSLLRGLRAVPGVKKVFIRSGIRFDYLIMDKSDAFFRELVRHHVSGQLKVAPEHVSDRVLGLMGKPPRRVFDSFAAKYRELNAEEGLKQYLVSYFISAHPGSGLKEAVELAEYLRDSGSAPEQVQDFYPTPGTLSTAMYRTGMNPLDGSPVHVPSGARERSLQRALMQYFKPENAGLVRDALVLADREDLIGHGPLCLVAPGPSGPGGVHATEARRVPGAASPASRGGSIPMKRKKA